MKKRVTIIILFLFTNLVIGKCNCFEDQIVEIGEIVKYDRILLFFQFDLRFSIKNGSFESDSTFENNNNLLYQEIIHKIESSILKVDCSDLPNQITVKFRHTCDGLSTTYKNEELIINNNLLNLESYSYFGHFNNANILYDTLKTIEKSFSFRQKVKNGNNTAFLYLSKVTNPFKPYTQQEEGVFFQIPYGLHKFEFKDDELDIINLTYQNICIEGCGVKPIRKGIVKGYYEEDTWFIELEFDHLKLKF